MAVVATIDTPTVQTFVDGSYQLSVVAHFVDGATNLPDKAFSAPLHSTAVSERTAAINSLAAQINDEKARLTRQQTAATYMAAAKTAIEGKI